MRVVVSGMWSSVRDIPTLLALQLDEIGISYVIVKHDFKKLGKKLRSVLRCDIVHFVSIKPRAVEGAFWVFCFIFLRAIGKKIIVHWIGTDVMELTPFFARCFSRLGNVHLSQAPWLVEELRAKGVNSTWISILPPLGAVCDPLPETLTVVTYLGGDESRNDFYGRKEVEKLATEFPDMNFLVLGKVGEMDKQDLPNVCYLGVVGHERMDDIYGSSTVLLRLTKHDGLSLMVLEALDHGRYVIWTKDFPYCYKVSGSSEAAECLEALKTVETVNEGGSNFINSDFNSNRWTSRLVNVYREIVGLESRG